MMQGPVASALTHLSGETNFIQVTPSPDPGLPKFNSINVPIDANVSTKIKAKIWAHEFIDFSVLLSSGAGDTRYHLSVSSQNGSAIANIGIWTSAFQVFVGVYTAKYPIEASALMKYSEIVRDLALRGADWRFYDTQFRLLRQANPTELPWGLLIGNFGSVLKILIMHAFQSLNRLYTTVRPPQLPDPLFLRGFAANIIVAINVLAAIINILVISVL